MSAPVQEADRGKDGQRARSTITLTGQVRGGKNNMIVTRNGLHVPKPEWAKWRNAMLQQVSGQQFGDRITAPCRATVRYWAGDRKRRDIPAILDSIWHVLERGGVVEDDSLIKSVNFDGGYDKENPRAIVELEEITNI